MTTNFNSPPAGAFSLVEVVVALGIFAIGMVGVIGLLAPIAGSVATSNQAEAAARVVDGVQSRLRDETLETIAGYLVTAEQLADKDATPGYDPANDDQVFFSNFSGDKVGRRDDAIWENSDREKFFEIALVRHDPLSPAGNDATAAYLAYHLRIRWPMFVATAGGAIQPGVNPSALVPIDHSHKQVIFFTGAARR